ncbi:MAG: 2-hydroxyacyl-CoA dehydratase [Dehalococcoidia bacterium]
MIELLRLCGFEEPDLEAELPRFEEAFNRLGITSEDVEQIKQRLRTYYNVELLGVRKLLGLYLEGLVNLVLAREDGKTKVIYGIMGAFDEVCSACVSKSDDVYMSFPSEIFEIVLGSMFGKLVPVLEAAEKAWLRAGTVAHCANLKTLLGLLVSDLIPRPDLVFTSGFLCDTAPKTTDLLSEIYGIPAFVQDTCQDREISEYPDAKRTTDLMVKSARRFAKRMEEVVGFEITDEMLWEQLEARKALMGNISQIRDLIEHGDPLAISPTHYIYLENLPRLAASNSEFLRGAVEATSILLDEVQQRIDKGVGAVDRGAPRILSSHPALASDPRLDHLITEMGIALVANEGGALFPPDGGHTPPVFEPKDPYEGMSMSLHMSLLQSLRARANILVEAGKRLKVDGTLCLTHVGCRTVVGDSLMVKRALAEELGLPVLYIEYEGFDPRVYNHEKLKRELELFKTMLHGGVGTQ